MKLNKIKVPKFIKKLFGDDLRMILREKELDLYWYLSGKPNPPVYSYKRKKIWQKAKNINSKIFIETGTCSGNTVKYMKNKFKKIYSIELDTTLAERAKNIFRNDKHIEILQGDSAEILPNLLRNINEPVVFWLDGHYSGEGTSKTNLETPIMQELQTILNHRYKRHLIMIDDARCFDGTHDYPTIESLREFLAKNAPDKTMSIERDVITIV